MICVLLCACVVSYCVLRMWVEYTRVILVCYELVTGGMRIPGDQQSRVIHTEPVYIIVITLALLLVLRRYVVVL